MNQTKKYLLFGCMAAVLVTADSFPAFAGDSELYGVSLDQEEQAKAPVALDITAVYGKTARLGSFVPLKIRLYGQPDKRTVFCIFLALFGVWLLATGGKPGNMELTPRGLFWGLMAGIGAASYSLLSRAPVKHHGSIPVSGMGMFIGGLALSLIAQSWKIPAGLDGRAILYMAVIVLLGTVGAFTLFLQGIALVGPVKAALLSCLEPLTAATLSVVWLHSSFSPTDLIGFACILATVVLMR